MFILRDVLRRIAATGARKVAVAYSIMRFQQQPEGMPCSSYIWDVNNPNTPDFELRAASQLCCVNYNPKDPNVISGGAALPSQRSSPCLCRSHCAVCRHVQRPGRVLGHATGAHAVRQLAHRALPPRPRVRHGVAAEQNGQRVHEREHRRVRALVGHAPAERARGVAAAHRARPEHRVGRVGTPRAAGGAPHAASQAR